jgi:1,2-beta-oligoglucan phosphorylase
MRLKNPIGLSFDFLDNGSVERIEVDPIRISLKRATAFGRSGANLYLRKRTQPRAYTALLGPESESRFEVTQDAYVAEGSWGGLDYRCVLVLAKRTLSWQWSIAVKNLSDEAVELDCIYVQDVGLKPAASGLINEYYASQYLERRILESEDYGSVVCCRQNMRESVGNPWLMMACRGTAVAASVDGMQLYGNSFRVTGIPEGLVANRLGGEYAGESSILALQERPFGLAPRAEHRSFFVATYLPDHPQATSDRDLGRLSALVHECDDEVPSHGAYPSSPPRRNLFNTSRFLPVEDLGEQELDRWFGKDRRQVEHDGRQLLSFFCKDNDHVVLRAKETRVDRPHAHIMQSGTGCVPDESIVSTTAFACGVFNSHLTQGNTNFNVLLSVCPSQFNLDLATGQRVVVYIDDKPCLLGVPSAFEMGLNHCRWIYKHAAGCLQVRTWTSPTTPRVHMDLKVLAGNPVRLLITHHFDPTNGWAVVPGGPRELVARPGADSLIARKFSRAQFRIVLDRVDSDCRVCGEEALYSGETGRPGSLFVLDVRDTSAFCMSFVGEVCSAAATEPVGDVDTQWLSDGEAARSGWRDLCSSLSLTGDHGDIRAIQEILPWYGMNALVHFLAPHGLEQFGGAAWGTRDVCQGPLDLLLCAEKYAEARRVLRTIFSHQNPDGGWPQWWMFDSYSTVRADSSHGDVVFWCIIALSNYIKTTGDLSFLEEVLPYYHQGGNDHAETAPLIEHLNRLVDAIIGSFIAGTALVPFGGGDWNDSLQPVSRELAQRMISSWTVEMNYQAFSQCQLVYERVGDTTRANVLKGICGRIKADFNEHLVKDGVVAGYGLVGDDKRISVLLHPSDTKTKVSYSLLPMSRGIISEIFTNEQAQRHLDLIEAHLKGPDGARLMDRPLKYKGGIQTFFQRAESSPFFGREIGLMYVHAHIRYAEAQARAGRADAFVKALRQAIPVGYREVVPCGDIRQSNCYYSSSDVAFKNRYEADDRYDEVLAGRRELKGGWRVYSSGPGIFIGLIVSRLLGLRREAENVIVDPVMPRSLDGLSASMKLGGRPVTFRYAVREGTFGPKAISIDGKAVELTREQNKYRQGGAVIPAHGFLAALRPSGSIVEIRL